MKKYFPSMFLFNHVSAVVAVALCLSATGLQSVRADQTNGMQGQLSAKDYKFATAAIQGGTMEASLGQLAAQKGTDQSVRDFGQRMAQDHQKANQELMQLIGQKGASITDASNPNDEKMTQHLQSLSGSEFDMTYMKHMVYGHKKTIKEFQAEAAKGDDADLKNWAAKTLPTIQEHLRLAESVEATVNSTKPRAGAQ